ncbi:MAG: DNA-binding response regulator [Maribacter sp.]|nr:MAG: DNA-binding response regulator [Maribacter sp.]
MSNTTLKSILIDDSALQRTALVNLIESHPNVELLHEYNSGINARSYIKENTIDLIFLDVEMPIIDGFELLESLDEIPQIIITTSNPDYAMRAFDHNVTDYLLKPIEKNRFNEAVKRAIANYSNVRELEEDTEYIYVNSSLKKIKVLLKDIHWIEGMGDYIKLITEDNSILILSTMKSFMHRLPQDKFLRIHKSYIVNLDKVDKFNTAIVEVCGKQLPLSRHKKDELEEALLND